MKKQTHSDKNKYETKSILNILFGRSNQDKTYKKDLIKQWSQMNTSQRRQFILGGIVGLIVFFGALFTVFFLLFRLFG
jgi:hypothetical protein